ncbi:MAG: MBL fold metallo-hydrolase [Clostridia bacterium]|nr:MBL fold metallo-hydrolase [Clostridia bacterium]
MKDIRWIDNNICQYIFIESEDKPNIDVNITVLINGKKAMLIDTAFANQASMVKNDLLSKGITVDEIILSHYHPDHAAGATMLPDAILSCSVHYEDNFNNCNNVWDKEHDYRKAQQIIFDNTTKRYGDFTLAFSETPGHSKCSIMTLIDDRIAHIGDLLMFDVSGKPILPYICDDGSFEEHMNSLKLLKTLGAEVFILSHGKHLVGKDEINHAIDMRIHYLESVLKSNGEADLEEVLIGGSDKWAFIEWHRYNLMNL